MIRTLTGPPVSYYYLDGGSFSAEQGCGAVGAHDSDHRAKGGETPSTGCQSITETLTYTKVNHTHQSHYWAENSEPTNKHQAKSDLRPETDRR